MEQIREEFQKTLRTFMDSRTITSLMEGRFTVEHYKSILRQIFHHTRENPSCNRYQPFIFVATREKLYSDSIGMLPPK